jgi:hypothetical protein
MALRDFTAGCMLAPEADEDSLCGLPAVDFIPWVRKNGDTDKIYLCAKHWDEYWAFL